jgi:hypothetical protein
MIIHHLLVAIFLVFIAILGFYSVRLIKKWLEKIDSSLAISVVEVIMFWASVVYLHKVNEPDIPSKIFIFATTWIGLIQDTASL